jgi:hypothetical protein
MAPAAAGSCRFLSVGMLFVASLMPRELLPWVEGASRLLERLFVGVAEKYLSLLECLSSLLLAV